MSDVLDQAEAPTEPTHVAIHRKDYRPPDWLVPEIGLEFALDPEMSRVRATMKVVRNGQHGRPLVLAGDGIRPLSVRADGGDARWSMDRDNLVIELAADEASI